MGKQGGQRTLKFELSAETMQKLNEALMALEVDLAKLVRQDAYISPSRKILEEPVKPIAIDRSPSVWWNPNGY